jgi:hypothetical protein
MPGVHHWLAPFGDFYLNVMVDAETYVVWRKTGRVPAANDGVALAMQGMRKRL